MRWPKLERKQNENIDSSSRVSAVERFGAGGIMVCGRFTRHILVPLVAIKERLNSTASLDTEADQVPQCVKIFYPDITPTHHVKSKIVTD